MVSLLEGTMVSVGCSVLPPLGTGSFLHDGMRQMAASANANKRVFFIFESFLGSLNEVANIVKTIAKKLLNKFFRMIIPYV